MVRPVYIVCCESVSQDKATNRLSFFHVIDQIGGIVPPPGRDLSEEQKAGLGENALPAFGVQFFTVAVWMREEADPEGVFEFELWPQFPAAGEVAKTTGQFRFAKPFHRVQVKLLIPQPPAGDGLLNIICRIRRITEDRYGDWIEQSYPVRWKMRHLSEEETVPDE